MTGRSYSTSMICWIPGLPVFCRAGHDSQVLRHLDLAAAVGVAEEDEDLEFRVQLRSSSSTSPTPVSRQLP